MNIHDIDRHDINNISSTFKGIFFCKIIILVACEVISFVYHGGYWNNITKFK